MSEKLISKDKKEIWYSHPILQPEGLYHAIFCGKNLAYLIFLEGYLFIFYKNLCAKICSF